MADEQKKGEQQKKAKPAKGDKGHAQVEAKPSPDAARHAAKERPRLRARFEKEVAVALMKELELKNPMAVPRLHKIVVNMGVGEATQYAKLIDPAVNELGQIAGQKPVGVLQDNQFRRAHRRVQRCSSALTVRIR